MAYPEYVRINGEKVKIKTDWHTALKAFNVIDSNVGDYERALAVVYIMYGFIPDDDLIAEYLNMAQKFLQCGENLEEQQSKDPDMDLIYDRKYINASFMSDYHIDLNDYPNMHFWQFCELITGLTDKCILSRVREIRTCNVDDYAPKDRPSIRKAKQELALPKKETAEQKKIKEDFDLLCPY